MDRKQHWENIYSTKKMTEVSWYQARPVVAINYLEGLEIAKDAAIIDVGGGDSFLVDYLLENNFSDITVLDISANAVERTKERLGEKASQVNWVVSDIVNYRSTKQYDFWHDRAAFHFLTNDDDINSYINNLKSTIRTKGKMVIGTFSDKGPIKCSGIEIKQYAENDLKNLFAMDFDCLSCQLIDHPTPFDTVQNFTFCSFIKR